MYSLAVITPTEVFGHLWWFMNIMGRTKPPCPTHRTNPLLKNPAYAPLRFSTMCQENLLPLPVLTIHLKKSSGFDSTCQKKLLPRLVLITRLKKTPASLPALSVCLHRDIQSKLVQRQKLLFTFVLFDIQSDWTELNWYYATLSLIWSEMNIVAALQVFPYDWENRKT